MLLGTEGGSYYAQERSLTRDNAKAVERSIREDSDRVLRRVLEVSESGRAPKNDPALFVLAMVSGLAEHKERLAALSLLPKIARTGTHLFHFVQYAQAFRGWGRSLRTAIGNWYNQKEPKEIVSDYRLPMEAIPPEKRSKEVWESVLPNLGLTGLIRNLGNLSKNKILAKSRFDITESVIKRITDENSIKKSRVHPIQILSALLTYGSGHGIKGHGEWTVVPDIIDALDKAFYLSFSNVEPSGKRGFDSAGPQIVNAFSRGDI